LTIISTIVKLSRLFYDIPHFYQTNYFKQLTPKPLFKIDLTKKTPCTCLFAS